MRLKQTNVKKNKNSAENPKIYNWQIIRKLFKHLKKNFVSLELKNNNLILVTRNIKHFNMFNVKLFNPFWIFNFSEYTILAVASCICNCAKVCFSAIV